MAAEAKTLPLLTTEQVGDILAAFRVLYKYKAVIEYDRLQVEALADGENNKASYYAFSISPHHKELRDAVHILFKEAQNFVGEHIRLRELLVRTENLAINTTKKLAGSFDKAGPIKEENYTLQEELLKKDEQLLTNTVKYDALMVQYEETKKKLEALEKQFSDGQ